MDPRTLFYLYYLLSDHPILVLEYISRLFSDLIPLYSHSSLLTRTLYSHICISNKSGNSRFLPQGYSTSPMLSFLAYHKMYDRLNTFAEKNNLTFSAYYDDFTFSSNEFIPKYCMKEAIKIINA